MKKNKVTISQDLIDDLKKYSEQVKVGMATAVRDDLTDEVIDSLGAFYSDYKPKYYKRHYYNFMDKSYRKYYYNPHGQIVRGGVELSYQFMDDIYEDETREVFDLVYHGFHGPQSVFGESPTGKIIPVMKPSPLDYIYKKRDYIVENIQDYKDRGLSRANSIKYKTID